MLDRIRPVDVRATSDRQHYVVVIGARKRWLNAGTLYPIHLSRTLDEKAGFSFRSAVISATRRDALVSPGLIDRNDAG